MRADFVHFGDATVIDPGGSVGAVTHHSGLRRSLCEPIPQNLGWAVGDSKTFAALVVRGVRRSRRPAITGVKQSRESSNHGRRAITGVEQSRVSVVAVLDGSSWQPPSSGQVMTDHQPVTDQHD